MRRDVLSEPTAPIDGREISYSRPHLIRDQPRQPRTRLRSPDLEATKEGSA
jgi:hypothetical protein